MKNVIDFVEFKKRKRQEKFTGFLNKYKLLLTAIVICTIAITTWSIVSFKAAMIFTALAILLPLVFSKKSYLPETERMPMSKPQ
ncbi:hypothetical protein [Bacillus marasmi]|uniref:hypothetical protein n=1 Tax=Bacillus marasmi TaxID=1926279 RepID=UPI0011C9BE7A|nr:hypothetical protein [Bacillus marasmi]